jgi:CMP-N,N'-diacetyllegionaminic acid synthase
MSIKPFCIIPARGSSKRLPRKNILLINGKPLIAYVIEAANESKAFDEIFVSTDDVDIAEVALSFGASVPFMRPKRLATDSATIVDVCLHMVEWAENIGRVYKDLCVLSPTCPLVSSRHMREAIALFEGADAQFLVSISDFDHPPFWALRMEGRRLAPFWGKDYIRKTQELPHLYRPNGAISLAKVAEFKRERTFYVPGLLGYYMPRCESIDIDDQFDLQVAECILRSKAEP